MNAFYLIAITLIPFDFLSSHTLAVNRPQSHNTQQML